ncbi:hypothetical protein Tco_1524521 [Tanacetum coccineum]
MKGGGPPPILWYAFAGWEVILTPMVGHDLLKLYGLVVKYCENHHVAGARLVFWGDLHIRSWRLYTLSNVNGSWNVSGEVLYMFEICILSSLSEVHGLKDVKAQD